MKKHKKSDDKKIEEFGIKPLHILYLILGIALVLRLVNLFSTSILWWDETIYIGMAKYLFSAGTLGYWETFRPVIFPIVLGLGWFFGLPIVIWGKIIEILASLGIIIFAYLIGEKISKYAGLIAASAIAFLGTFMTFGQLMLTGIPATFFMLVGFWFLLKEKWYWAGVFVGLAFLTRFLFGVVAVAVGVGIIIAYLANKDWKSSNKTNNLIKTSWHMLLGFFTFTIPYFISNIIIYGDFFHPLVEGSRVFTQYNNWLYDLGNGYYLTELLTQNFMLLFFVIGLFTFIIQKKWTSPTWNAIIMTTILFVTYLFSVVHKEIRFLIPVFILLAILYGAGILWLIKEISKKLGNVAEFFVFFAAIFFVLINLLITLNALPDLSPTAKLTGLQYEYYHYFENETIDSPLFIASNPLHMVYTDKPVTMLRSWELAEEVHSRYGNKSSHIAVDTCDKPCETGNICETQRDEFLNHMNKKYVLIYNKSYDREDLMHCDVFIWKTNNK